MKNKGIIGSIIALAVVLIGVFAYQMGSRQTGAATEQKEEVKTVGILQTISHPSLDQIKDGVVEGLKQEGYEDGKTSRSNFLMDKEIKVNLIV
jgi:putative tryptophan/tyrosine transport system substrate-binding protein